MEGLKEFLGIAEAEDAEVALLEALNGLTCKVSTSSSGNPMLTIQNAPGQQIKGLPANTWLCLRLVQGKGKTGAKSYGKPDAAVVNRADRAGEYLVLKDDATLLKVLAADSQFSHLASFPPEAAREALKRTALGPTAK